MPDFLKSSEAWNRTSEARVKDGTQAALGKASPSPKVLAVVLGGGDREGRGSGLHLASSGQEEAVPREPHGWGGGQGS